MITSYYQNFEAINLQLMFLILFIVGLWKYVKSKVQQNIDLI